MGEGELEEEGGVRDAKGGKGSRDDNRQGKGAGVGEGNEKQGEVRKREEREIEKKGRWEI